ncbi:carboxymuconolactone decarboxylase family protein [Kutzneria buriramensis]|uniref:Alkylhydroperoxidase/carboxymuconolactone decarboxylase family protein YurZ n=1 Tax=Kutzneria buriramensis TaxID=1045776 RepID=A0A3E0HG99_9PSEU|nr:carboxymuconolactone decarboxylase family protein [Kutzneria buriramensis]REH44739.1 alkylhydroperoxidase/carboxymuconolactone decarboxylase family protein YurZ [Kutzneria buriramensis]
MTSALTVGDRLRQLDPVFAQMTLASVGHARAIPELTDREKTFLNVVADICQGSLGLAFEAHVRAGLNAGVTVEDLRDVLRFVSYDIGYAAAVAGFEALAAFVEEPSSAPLLDEAVLTGSGSPLPAVVRERLEAMDPHFAEYFDLQSRMRAGLGTLTERERGLVSMSVDVHYRTLGDTFRIHVDRALRGGASPDDVRAALRFIGQYGVTRAWEAWQVLNPLLG